MGEKMKENIKYRNRGKHLAREIFKFVLHMDNLSFLKKWFEEQKVVAKNLENDNTKLRKLLSEACQILKIIEKCSLFIHKPDKQEKEKVKENIK